MVRCPNCRREVKPRQENEAFPFCSPRCRALDLSRWFTGGYRVPGEPVRDAPREETKDDDPQ